MLELFGIPLGTPFQGGTLLAIIAAIGIWWVRGMPDRHRAKNEGRAIDDADAAQKRKEEREERHLIKNNLAKALAELVKCNQLATAANARNEQLMFLFELLLSEMEVSSHDSKIVQRARLMFNRMSTELKDPSKSDALNAAETTAEDTKIAAASAKDACEEVKRAEGAE